MNIAEILKKCPKGTKLYSSLYGEVELVKVKEDDLYPIVLSCLEIGNYIIKFDKDGKKILRIESLYSSHPRHNAIGASLKSLINQNQSISSIHLIRCWLEIQIQTNGWQGPSRISRSLGIIHTI